MTGQPKILARPRDERGYPIPFFQWINPETGEPDFRVIDPNKLMIVLDKRLCGLCGQPLGRHIHFIGGPLCHGHGHFLDPGMHKACAEFALATCPHLAQSKGKYNEGALPSVGGQALVVNEAVGPKAEIFALMHTTDYQVVTSPTGFLIKAKLPWLDVAWWRDGQPVPAPDAP